MNIIPLQSHRTGSSAGAQAWLCAAAFLLTLGGIVAVGCILAATVSWQ